MEGLSADAILLGRHWVRFLDGEDGRTEPFECLGADSRNGPTRAPPQDSVQMLSML